MPTKSEMRQEVIDRIAKLRKTSDDMKKVSEAARKFVTDVMLGTVTPTDKQFRDAAVAIAHADDIILYCFNVEEKLRKLADSRGITL